MIAEQTNNSAKQAEAPLSAEEESKCSSRAVQHMSQDAARQLQGEGFVDMHSFKGGFDQQMDRYRIFDKYSESSQLPYKSVKTIIPRERALQLNAIKSLYKKSFLHKKIEYKTPYELVSGVLGRKPAFKDCNYLTKELRERLDRYNTSNNFTKEEDAYNSGDEIESFEKSNTVTDFDDFLIPELLLNLDYDIFIGDNVVEDKKKFVSDMKKEDIIALLENASKRPEESVKKATNSGASQIGQEAAGSFSKKSSVSAQIEALNSKNEKLQAFRKEVRDAIKPHIPLEQPIKNSVREMISRLENGKEDNTAANKKVVSAKIALYETLLGKSGSDRQSPTREMPSSLSSKISINNNNNRQNETIYEQRTINKIIPNSVTQAASTEPQIQKSEIVEPQTQKPEVVEPQTPKPEIVERKRVTFKEPIKEQHFIERSEVESDTFSDDLTIYPHDDIMSLESEGSESANQADAASSLNANEECKTVQCNEYHNEHTVDCTEIHNLSTNSVSNASLADEIHKSVESSSNRASEEADKIMMPFNPEESIQNENCTNTENSIAIHDESVGELLDTNGTPKNSNIDGTAQPLPCQTFDVETTKLTLEQAREMFAEPEKKLKHTFEAQPCSATPCHDEASESPNSNKLRVNVTNVTIYGIIKPMSIERKQKGPESIEDLEKNKTIKDMGAGINIKNGMQTNCDAARNSCVKLENSCTDQGLLSEKPSGSFFSLLKRIFTCGLME
ncbi:hypothetical protein ENBRE01_0255 [Enteropsectra breve]|nr:hypothetical protein ENBRE01_0255 [Enteropsectra breve]